MDEAQPGTWATPYWAVLRSRLQAQRAYPASFATDLLSALLVGLVEFGEVWIIFDKVKVLGGLDLRAILLVFGLSNVSFAVADLLVGHLDELPNFIRLGTIDAFYLRPLPLLAQLMTCEIALRRLARVAVAAAVLCSGLVLCDISWSPAKCALLVATLIAGIALFAGIFVCAAGLQFFLVNGAEFTNSFTYGGSFASQQPASVFPAPMKLVFSLLVPVTFTAYLPAVTLLGLPGVSWLPAWLGWFAPLAAAWTWLLAWWVWRLGTKHYQGGGG